MRTYYLDAKVKGETSPQIEEVLRNRNKRSPLIMEHTIEALDKLTGKFESFEELSKEFAVAYNSTKELYDPLIIVDEDIHDLSKSYFIPDVVFEEDQKVLSNPDYIKTWLLEYLLKNPGEIYRIKGVRNIFQSKYHDEYTKGIIDERIINQIVHAYLLNPSYKKYRDIYFALKKYDQIKEEKNEIHR